VVEIAALDRITRGGGDLEAYVRRLSEEVK
jgi:hypothetical protein